MRRMYSEKQIIDLVNNRMGTKLYRHEYTDGSENYNFVVIKTTDTPIPECDNFVELWSELTYKAVSPVLDLYGNLIVFQADNQPLAVMKVFNGDMAIEECDDITLAGSVDTITKL